MSSPENVGQQFRDLPNLPIGARGKVRVGDLVNNPNVKFWDYDVAGHKGREEDLERAKTTKTLGINDTTLYDSIKQHGVAEPIHVSSEESGEAMVLGGHHRIAVAHDINPDMEIPFTKLPSGMVMPGYMTAKGNCPSCYGDGTDWESEDENSTAACTKCGGKGFVDEK